MTGLKKQTTQEIAKIFEQSGVFEHNGVRYQFENISSEITEFLKQKDSTLMHQVSFFSSTSFNYNRSMTETTNTNRTVTSVTNNQSVTDTSINVVIFDPKTGGVFPTLTIKKVTPKNKP